MEKAIGKTEYAYRIRLDDMSCDHDGCDKYAETIIVYATETGKFFHFFGCNDHQKVLSKDSALFEEIEDG